MSKTPQHLGIAGLYTDPNPHVAVPQGALSEADEVVIRRVGTVEPRPGFKNAPNADELLVQFPGLDELYRLIPFAGDYVAVGFDGEGTSSFWASVPGTSIDDPDAGGGMLSWVRDAIRGVEAREQLYLTTSNGVRRMLEAGDVEAWAAGLVPPTLVKAGNAPTGSVVPAGTNVAYRATLELHLPGGLVITSAPSGRVVYMNDGGTTTTPVLRATARNVPEIDGAKVYLKFYRSPSTASAVPPDDLFLILSAEITGDGDITTSNFPDTTLDSELGEALYTNSRREGIERANIRPPACKDLCLYQGSLVAGNITRQARVRLRWTEGGDLSGEDDGIGTRTYTGTRTNDSDEITGLSDTDGLEVGMILHAASSWEGAGPVRILDIDGTTLVMSEVWGGATDGAPASMTFVDSICVGDPAVAENYFRADEARNFLEGFNDVFAVSRITRCQLAFAYGVSSVSEITGSTDDHVPATRSVAIEALSALTTLEIRATHGEDYDPVIPDIEDVSPLEVAPEHLQNAVMWSKQEEPEHFMLGALRYIGHQGSPILRLISTRDAVWVLKGKGDGVHRFSGFSERAGFRTDKKDSTTHLLHAELACALDEVAYAWTSQGMCAISDAGVIPLSRPIRNLGRDAETHLDHTQVEAACLAVANLKDGEVIFGLPVIEFGEEEDPGMGPLYVYNTHTKAWVRWFVDLGDGTVPGLACAAYDLGARQLLLGRADEPRVLLERVLGEGDDGAILHADSVSDEDGLDLVSIEPGELGVVVTIEEGGTWTPRIGDLVKRDGYGVVLGLLSGTEFLVNDDHGLEAPGAATAWRAFKSQVAWVSKTGDGPATLKLFRELLLHFESTYGVATFDVVYLQTKETNNAEVKGYELAFVRSERAHDQRASIPRSQVRGSRLLPRFRVLQADSRWRLSGLSLSFDSVSTRVSP